MTAAATRVTMTLPRKTRFTTSADRGRRTNRASVFARPIGRGVRTNHFRHCRSAFWLVLARRQKSCCAGPSEGPAQQFQWADQGRNKQRLDSPEPPARTSGQKGRALNARTDFHHRHHRQQQLHARHLAVQGTPPALIAAIEDEARRAFDRHGLAAFMMSRDAALAHETGHAIVAAHEGVDGPERDHLLAIGAERRPRMGRAAHGMPAGPGRPAPTERRRRPAPRADHRRRSRWRSDHRLGFARLVDP